MMVGASLTDSRAAGADRVTLDDLFRRAAVRSPDAVALADPDDRARVTGGEPRRLSYAQADRMIWAIAARLRALGLGTDSMIGVQLPNNVETVLTLLGVLRAGMIPALLPMLWRETEIVAALSAVSAKAIVTTSRIGATDHGALAGRVAAALFSIRHVCAFGNHLADGIVPLDDALSAPAEMRPAEPRDGDPAMRTALVTFEPTPRGILPVARNHRQLIAAGALVVADAALSQDAVLISATPPATFAGLATSVMPWLLTGGRLVLHQPFDARLFRDQIETHECHAVVVPGPLAEAFDGVRAGAALIALWRAPERLGDAPPLRNVVDVTAFGEFGLYISPRSGSGQITPLPLGTVRRSASGASVIETRRGPKGTLLLHGVTAAGPATADGAGDFIDTGYPCRIDPASGTLIITGPQPGMIGVGGYRIARNEIDAPTASIDGPIAALPDALLGQRLRGRAADPAAAQLAARGINPLIGGAVSDGQA